MAASSAATALGRKTVLHTHSSQSRKTVVQSTGAPVLLNKVLRYILPALQNRPQEKPPVPALNAKVDADPSFITQIRSKLTITLCALEKNNVGQSRATDVINNLSTLANCVTFDQGNLAQDI
jgi:hypothetical protein